MFLRNLSGIGFNNNTMANISTFQMADVISADKNISVKKGILGLTTKYVYIPTESRIRGYIKEYSMVTGEKLHAILNSPIEQIEDVINSFEESEMGNYRLEMCVSDDKQFVMQEMIRSMQNNMAETAWPKTQFLWALHPIITWANDKNSLLFARGEAPIISVPQKFDGKDYYKIECEDKTICHKVCKIFQEEVDKITDVNN